MRPRFVVARKELAGVLRERTILLAVVIQVFVAGFSSFLVVGLSALVDPEAFPNGAVPAVAINGTSSLGARLAQEGIEPRTFASDAAAMAAFRAGEVDGVLLWRQGTGDDGLPVTVRLVLPDGDFRATLTLVKVKAALEDHERMLRTANAGRLTFDPVYLETEATAGHYSFVYSLLVPLLVLLPVVLAGALVADSITEEMQRGTLPLLLASPATAADVVEGKVLANVALVPPLLVAWFLLLALNGLPVPVLGAVGILLLATSIAAVLALVACGISLLVRDRNRAHVVYATALFTLLGGSLALPVSPVNAVARLAGGSAGGEAWTVVLGAVAAAACGAAALRLAVRAAAQRLASGS